MTELRYDGEKQVRLDRFLLAACPALSAGALHKYLRENKIKLNGRRQPLHTRLVAGDVVRLFLPEDATDALHSAATAPETANHYPLDVLFEDENLLAVDKPAGLLCQEEGAGIGKDTLLLRAQRYVAQQAPYAAPPALCHRLDTGTSGVVLLAKNAKTLAFMEDLIRRRMLTKEYLCVTIGRPAPARGTLESWLRKDARHGRVTVSHTKTPGAKEARARYETLSTGGRLALLKVTLITGRTHQIRAQLAFIGTPVLGDSKYGEMAINRALRCRYQCLCAWRLCFPEITDPAFCAYSRLEIACKEPWYVGQVKDGTLVLR